MNSNNFANNVSNSVAGASPIVKALVIVIGVVVIYYVYQYFFTSTTTMQVLFPEIRSTEDNNSKEFVADTSKLPPMYEGGEYTLSAWVYVKNWSKNSGKNKHVMSIGACQPDPKATSGTFNTLTVYLGANTNDLHVRVHAINDNSTTSGTTATMNPHTMKCSDYTRIFSDMQVDGGILNQATSCDVQNFDLQKWNLITVALNGRTCDVYLNGKLARSCVLPEFYKVPAAYSVFALGQSTYGGFMSNLLAADYAMNPEEVYRMYMGGPTGYKSFWDTISSFFSADAMDKTFYPKMN
jgi:hypothetical protein